MEKEKSFEEKEKEITEDFDIAIDKLNRILK